jgi:LysM domain
MLLITETLGHPPAIGKNSPACHAATSLRSSRIRLNKPHLWFRYSIVTPADPTSPRHTMNHPRTLTAILASPLLLLVSCSVQSDEYDTPPPYTAPADPANAIYDSPAAYEHDVPGNPAAIDPGLPVDPGASTPAAPVAPTASNIPASSTPVVHTVEKGDTLSGLSSKYKIPMASIRSANNMTSDTVVLGKKMVIPAQ